MLMNEKIPSRRRFRAGLPLLALCACSILPSTFSQRVFHETFEGLPLGPNVDEAVAGLNVWTKTPPPGWSIDDSLMPGVGIPSRDGITEWSGWSFANKLWWIRADDQRRSEFTLADGTVMIADPDEWDDAAHDTGFFHSIVTTGPIPITNAAANSLVLVYDSSWRPEATDDGAPSFPVGPDGERINDQTAVINMKANGGAATELQRWTSIGDTATYHDHNPNETVILPLNNAANLTNLVLEFGLTNAANDWWWAVDNLAIGAPPFVYAISATGVSFTNRMVETLGRTVDQSKGIVVELDGAPVTPIEVTKEGDFLHVSYSQAPRVFTPGSRHSVKVKYTTDQGAAREDTTEFVAPGYTSVSATVSGITAQLRDAEWLTIDETKALTFQLDGANITASSVAREDAVVRAQFSLPQPFVSGSTHTFKATFTTGEGQVVEDTVTFIAPQYHTLPASLGTAIGTGAQLGIKWRSHMTETARAASIAEAEVQLRGGHGVSLHDPSGQTADGYFEIDFVNFEQNAGEAGHFRASGDAPQNVEDVTFPGLPDGGDRMAGEALAFVEIPAPGVYTMVVNSDDGFQLSVGTTNDPNNLVLGKWDSTRGAADSQFYFQAEQAGVYLFRLLWFEGTGGASVEWFTVNADGTRALVGGTQPGALKAFRARTVGEPQIDTNAPTFIVTAPVAIHPAAPTSREAGIAINTDANEALVVTILTENPESLVDPVTGQVAQHIMVGYFINPTTLAVTRGPFPIVGNPHGNMENHDVEYNPVSKKYMVVTSGQTYAPNGMQVVLGAVINNATAATGTNPVLTAFAYDAETTENYDDVSLAVSTSDGNMLLVAERNFLSSDSETERNEGAVGVMFDKDGTLLTTNFTRLDIIQPNGDEDDPEIVYLPQRDAFFFYTNTDDNEETSLRNRLVGLTVDTAPTAANTLTLGPVQTLADDRKEGVSQGHPAVIENPFNGELIGAFDYNNGSAGGDLFYFSLNAGGNATRTQPQVAYLDEVNGVVPYAHRHPQLAADPNSGVIALVHNFSSQDSALPPNGIGFTLLGPDGEILPGRPADKYIHVLTETEQAVSSSANYYNVAYDPNSGSFIVIYNAGGVYAARLDVTSTHLEPGDTEPELAVQRTANGAKLTWPMVAGFVLERTGRLGGTWNAVTDAPTVENGNNTLTVNTSGAAGFFRLRKP